MHVSHKNAYQSPRVAASRGIKLVALEALIGRNQEKRGGSNAARKPGS
jgi:K+-transporting ATPase c subunit